MATRRIAFTTASDGLRLAFGVHGSGTAVVKAANWMTHLDHDWQSPVWRHWLEGFAAHHTLVHYDERGCGLSDRHVDEDAFTLDRWVADLEAVVDAAGLDRFALLGISQGAALAVAYAVRHPERVSHIVVYGGYVRGRFRRDHVQREEAEVLVEAIRVGWGRSNSAFRRLFTTLFVPDGTPEQMTWFDEIQRTSASPETAARIWEARGRLDVTDLAAQVRTPTLVAHARDTPSCPSTRAASSPASFRARASCRSRAAATSCSPTSPRGRRSWARSRRSWRATPSPPSRPSRSRRRRPRGTSARGRRRSLRSSPTG